MSTNLGQTILEPPRWAGGPPICAHENLPAFGCVADVTRWREKPGNPLYEANPIKRLWLCHHCGQWHYTTKMRPPSGSSSGSGRESKGR